LFTREWIECELSERKGDNGDKHQCCPSSNIPHDAQLKRQGSLNIPTKEKKKEKKNKNIPQALPQHACTSPQ
jgi:hypothetical protein